MKAKVRVLINETLLLQKYDKDVRRIVNHYLYSTQFSTSCSFYEDLINEAFIAFLCMCRSFNLESYAITDLQRAMCKKKIESTLRVYIWKLFNMGGYNNKKIDLSRSVTISDILGDTDFTIDDVVPNIYQEDFSAPDTRSFFDMLKTQDIQLLNLLDKGYSFREICGLMKRDISTLVERANRIRQKYINYEKSASAA